jgi:Mg/Co/Ni transporter MgtE
LNPDITAFRTQQRTLSIRNYCDAFARERYTGAVRDLVARPCPRRTRPSCSSSSHHDERRWLTEALAANFDSETLAELSPEAAEDVIEALGTREIGRSAGSELETDDAVHILEDLGLLPSNYELLEGMPLKPCAKRWRKA